MGNIGESGQSMKKHLLVTNDYPPKVGGIQNYLWELWRRLPADKVTVFTPSHPDAEEFDLAQEHRVVRDHRKVFLPSRRLATRINDLAHQVEAELVVLDPALPLGHLGPALDLPYVIVAHGAEITVPGRLPGARFLLSRVLRGAEFVVSAGGYPAQEASRAAGRQLKTIEIPPGVDQNKFQPQELADRLRCREGFGLTEAPLVVGVSRLVPRKGFDRTIEAVASLRDAIPGIQLAIAGTGRDSKRLARISQRLNIPVRLLGRVPESELPAVFAMGDVFVMPCRNRWAGLEQEGFGIVFTEAAASGVPQVAGRSGGAHEAVVDGVTGIVVNKPGEAREVGDAILSILQNPEKAKEMSEEGRKRSVDMLSYDLLADRLKGALS